MKKFLFSILIVLLALSVAACGGTSGRSGGGSESAGKKDRLVIAGKQFTEQVILAHMLSELIQKNTDDLEVVTRANLGPTDVLMQGMKDGDIDMYVEYTGTAYMIVLKQQLDTQDPDVIYDRVKKGYEEQYGITWLTPFRFNNTYAIAIREEQAQELNIVTISDLAKHAKDFVLGTEYDFLEREDGIKNFNKTYGIEWKEVRGMDRGLTYDALKNKEVDAIVAFATDGRIPKFNLRVLQDDKQFFPPYFGTAIIKMDKLEKHPEIAELIDKLAPLLTDETMAQLNSRVDIDGEEEDQVAHDFLVEHGLIQE